MYKFSETLSWLRTLNEDQMLEVIKTLSDEELDDLERFLEIIIEQQNKERT